MKTLLDVVTQLRRYEPSSPLVFTTEAGEISAGYHVTELRHSLAKGIDCGGQIEAWQEARLQLLDGAGETHMSLAKFISIIEKSMAALPELEHAALKVEFGHQNAELRLMSLQPPQFEEGRVVVPLGETRALCKPAQRKQSAQADVCCGDAAVFAQLTSCCVPSGAQSPATPCCA